MPRRSKREPVTIFKVPGAAGLRRVAVKAGTAAKSSEKRGQRGRGIGESWCSETATGPVAKSKGPGYYNQGLGGRTASGDGGMADCRPTSPRAIPKGRGKFPEPLPLPLKAMPALDTKPLGPV